MAARDISEGDQDGGVLLGEESATTASKLSGKVKCIIMQCAMAIVSRRSVLGKEVVKELMRQAPFTSSRSMVYGSFVLATPQCVTGIGCSARS